jgi:glucose/arabinose dehydrogenase
MKTPLIFLGFLAALSPAFGQPFGLTNRVANTTLQLPAALPTTHPALMNAVNYFIPADNPFVGATHFNGTNINTNALRAEFWAVGLRNPWRMSFDRVTGTLYVGDVGGSLREEINVILRGSNYGWAYREGTINGPKSAQAPAGFTSMPPIAEYLHGSAQNQGNSVTGGLLYRGNRVPALDGKYVFCDYVSGNVWSLTPNGTNVVPFTYLTNDANITAFGLDPSNGDVLMADIVANQIKRLVNVPVAAGVGISNAFPGVTFTSPICIASPPGETNRLFILERAGRVTVITNLAAPNRTLFMDISSRVITGGEEGLLGIAFHPNYAANRYFYLFYSLNTNTTAGTGRHQRVARFQTSASDPNVGVVASELPLITQFDDYSNHNGGDLHFGPDGYLYISLGDEGNQNDTGNNSQRIDKDFFSGILRIDVDKRPGNLPPLNGPAPPATLDQTGAFSDLVNLIPNPGIVEYDVNVPQWADNAITRHWFCITNPASRMGFRPTASWQFASSGSVWIQHFELETTNGVPGSRQRVETRFLYRDGLGATYGITYRWTSPTNATLVAAEGASATFAINDGGVLRDQVWNYPAQSECLRCHNATVGRVLGFNTPQLNRDFNYNGIVDNQIRALNNAGYFAPAPQPQPTNNHLLLSLALPTSEGHSLEYRSRSHFMANCSSCHVGAALPTGSWDARIYTPVSTANLINGPLLNNRGDAANRVVVPGDTAHSMLLTFLSTVGGGHTQSLGTTLVDTQAVSLVTRWIQQELPSYRTYAQWQVLHFGSTGVPQAATDADPDGDGARNLLEYLTGTNPNTPGDAWDISVEQTPGGVDIVYERIANRHFEIQWAPNINSNSVWRGLNVPENRPFAAISNSTWRVPDTATNGIRYYRARVYEP